MIRAALTMTAIFLVAVESPAEERSLRVDVVGTVNHGATMHGTQMADRSAVGLNACCDYNTRLGEGAVLANGSATHFDQVIPANSFAEGVPAVVNKQNITDEDRKAYFGLVPAEWTRYEGRKQEENAQRKQQ